MRGLGGSVVGGALNTEFNVSTVGELQQVPYETLVRRFGDFDKKRGGVWIYRIARGICLDAVSDRELARRYECQCARIRSNVPSSRVHTKGCSCFLLLPPSSPQCAFHCGFSISPKAPSEAMSLIGHDHAWNPVCRRVCECVCLRAPGPPQDRPRFPAIQDWSKLN